jgi:hypothetical protein
LPAQALIHLRRDSIHSPIPNDRERPQHRGMAKLLAYEQAWIARDIASRDLTSR